MEGDVERAVATIVTARSRLDAAVHTAGLTNATPVDETSRAEWDRVLAAGLRSGFLVGRAALRTMSARERGSIVLLGALSDEGAASAAAKAGVVSLMRSLARAGGPLGIRANCVHPGESAAAVGEAAVWLASDRSAFVTGAELRV